MNNSFSAAYCCLDDILRRGAYSHIAVTDALKNCPSKDKPLATKLIYGVLENNIKLEYIIRQRAKSVKPVILIILKIAVYALSELNVADFTVVDNCVELTRHVGKFQLCSFVNAVLRNLIEDIKHNSIAYPTDTIDNLSVRYSYPVWVVEMLIRQYGLQFTQQFVQHKSLSATYIRTDAFGDNKHLVASLLQKNNIKFKPTALDFVFEVEGSEFQRVLPSKIYTIQSITSVLVCLALGVTENAQVLDCCAAPGGKSLLASTLAKNVTVSATDIHPHRVQLIAKYAAKFNAKNINAFVMDACKFDSSLHNKFDNVLCDVPCSGLGVVGTKPDILINKDVETVNCLSQLQLNILNNCSKYVKPGGTLVYSTCTVLSQENQDVVNEFLKANSGFVCQPIQLPIMPSLKVGEFLQFIPHLDGIDGFFIAKLKKAE